MQNLMVKVENKNGTLVTTSNRVAEELGVRHDNLLSKIDEYLEKFGSPKLSGGFYIPSEYKHSQNKQVYRNYLFLELVEYEKKEMIKMNDLTIRNFEGAKIEFKVEKGMVYANATSMCKAFGKEVKHWLANESTKELINEVSCEVGIPTSQLILIKKGNSSQFEQGTWIHEELILELASWLNIKFRRWCQKQISTLLREGNVSIKKVTDIQSKRLEIMEMNAKTRAAKQLTKLAEMAQTDKMREIAISLGVNLIVGKNAIPLPVATKQERTYSAGEIGETLGVSGNQIGRIANINSLKTDEFGEWVHDKSKYSNKEVRTFRYFEKAIDEFKKYL